jgi:hypothetical protein
VCWHCDIQALAQAAKAAEEAAELQKAVLVTKGQARALANQLQSRPIDVDIDWDPHGGELGLRLLEPVREVERDRER